MPGTSASRQAAARTGESGVFPACGPVSPVASTPHDWGIRASASVAPFSIWVIRWSRNLTWSISAWAITPWWESNMPSRASASWARLARSGPLARSAILAGSRSPSIRACTIATTDLAFIPSEATEVILTIASSSSFSIRCMHRVRSRTRSSRARVKSRSARIAAGGTNDGRSMPHWVSRASHIASSLSVFGRPLRFFACDGETSWTASPMPSST